MRLFIAIPLPEEAKAELVELQRRLTGPLKIVEKENLHMTMRFIGEGNAEEWTKKLESIGEKAFTIVFDQIGVFPNKDYIRVVWVGCGPSQSLLNIHRVIGEGELSPHVTLARVKGKPDKSVFELLKEKISIEVRVDRVLLMKSILTPEGPKYEVIHEKTL
ncbi:MAG: RNA 2',3'-cyclic phosphodiesterase [Candidatus Diapherotrites archaeon]|nr:RNA 2',3'-cyclic phosphodiesterase [Candidatus Diapherotrites archaeon]